MPIPKNRLIREQDSYKASNYEVFCRDCRDVLKKLNLRKRVKAIVTSPPYKEEDGFSWELMQEIIPLLLESLRDDGLIYLNFGHLTDNKSRPWEIALLMQKAGFYWVDTITWEKKQYSPCQRSRRLDNKTEFIYMMTSNDEFAEDIRENIFDNYLIQMAKSKNGYELDRLSIGVPYKDKSNIGRYSNIDLHCRGNHWVIGYTTIQWKWQKRHKNVFPKQLVSDCLKLSKCQIGDTFLDPFGGSFTSIEVAVEEFGMYGIGIEKDRESYESGRELLERVGKSGNG
jgi:site-specific DNA-methyltransferase (adenine-specific)